MDNQRYLFVCGCPRSGTTALLWLLNSHPQIAIGVERFKKYAKPTNINKLNSSCFKPEHFFNIKPGETNLNPNHKSWEKEWKPLYQSLQNKFFEKDLVVGDKYPHYYLFYDDINEKFDLIKWIFIIRDIHDVSMSYNSRSANLLDRWPEDRNYIYAVSDWNESLEKTWQFLEKGAENLLICEYEKLFQFNPDYLNRVVDFLEVSPDLGMTEYYREITKDWEKRCLKSKDIDPNHVKYIDAHANWKLRDMILQKYGV